MKIVKQNLILFFVLIMITGVIYPVMMTFISSALFKNQSMGSLIEKNGQVIGSALLSQEFKRPEYFWPRPSAANFDPSSSAASNLSPDSKALASVIAERAMAFGLSPDSHDDLLYASASGLDPHISPDSALRQLSRIVKARGLDERRADKLRDLVLNHLENKQFGILGRERINVLKLNLLLDEQF